jgi:hypothetical protein
MNRNIVFALLFVQSLAGCGDHAAVPTPPVAAPEKGSLDKAAQAVKKEQHKDSLPIEIVEQMRVAKGGSLDPVAPPKYVLISIKAALKAAPESLPEAKVRATLSNLLNSVRSEAEQAGEQMDGVSALLYQSRVHLAGGSPAIGSAEWWPKGHSFSPENVTNITNKSTYVEKIEIFSLPKPVAKVVERLSEIQRQALFTESVRTEDRARREAEAQFPHDASKMPIEEIRSFDFAGVAAKCMDREDELRMKYRLELLQKHDITYEEFECIRNEAFRKQWPMPPYK